MSDKPRYVFDTNVIVSAMLFEDSVPGQAFYAALRMGEILLSQATARELQEVLSRKKFDRYLTAEEREQFLVTLVQRSTMIEAAEDIHVCRDPKDDKLLDLVKAGNASCLVTGDNDLLALNPIGNVPIMTPAQFVESATEKN
jgi:putative PIN family toxin of toxin-antitoxin system